MFNRSIIAFTVKDILYFPFWWYSVGFWRCLVRLGGFLSERQNALGLFVWIKNIFTPMYGQYDWQGEIISFFVRIIQIIIRGILMIFWLLISLVAVMIWILLPALVVYEIIFQLFL